LSDDIAHAIKEIAYELQNRYELEFEKIGTDGDHIHALMSFHPKYSISQLVGAVKSITAKQLFLRFPELRKQLWGGEFWSDGYYVSTVIMRGDWKTVERYVANQGKGTTGNPLQLRLV
jgi:putative transposase